MEGIKGKVLESSCLWPAAPPVTAPQAILHSSEKKKKDSLTICCSDVNLMMEELTSLTTD